MKTPRQICAETGWPATDYTLGQIKAIQDDALEHAAEITLDHHLHGMDRTARGFYDTILSARTSGKKG